MIFKPQRPSVKHSFENLSMESVNSNVSMIMNVEEWEIRPGGMLVQKRNSDSNQNFDSLSTITVTVKYGSAYHQICINSQASFGELKKLLAEHTGLHPEEQKLIYKKKDRDSKAYLDVARVKNGSKIVLVQDITNREKRCLEMIRMANIQKASKSMEQISLDINKFAHQVRVFEAAACRGEKVRDIDLDNLIGKLMTELVKLDEIIVVDGDLKLQKRKQVKRVQNYVETLDRLKVLSSSSVKIPGQKQEHKQGNLLKQSKQRLEMLQPLRHSEFVVVTTTWETFD